MTEAYKVVWLDYGKSWFEARLTGNATSEKYHHDAEVQRLVAEARAEAITEILRIVTAYRKEAGQRADGKTLQALDDLRWDLRDLADQSNDAPPRQVTPQEAAKVLLEAGALTAQAVEAAHQQIDWCRNDQHTHTSDHPSQRPGTSCAEDIQDAWIAALRALANGGDSDG